VLEWGGANLEDAIVREVGLTAPEAAEMKARLELGVETAVDEDPRVGHARTAATHELETLARELIAALRFYQSQPGSLAISKVLVTGGTTKLPGLLEELERVTGVRIQPADPLAGVQAADTVGVRDDLPSLAVAIGLGIEV